MTAPTAPIAPADRRPDVPATAQPEQLDPTAENAEVPAARRHSRSLSRRLIGRVALLAAVLCLFTPSALTLQAWHAPHAAAAITDEQLSAGGVLRESTTQPVAPGLDLTTFSRLEEPGWNEGSVLTADLTESTLSLDVQDTGTVTGRAPLPEVMRSGENGERAVAAVNGTFFDINHSDAPIFTSVSRDGLRTGNGTPQPSLTVTDGLAAVQKLSATGTLTDADGTTHELAGMNTPRLDPDGIGLYTAAWGDYTLDRPVGAPDAPAQRIATATVVDGTVTEVSGIVDSVGSRSIPAGAQLLLGREAGADTIAALQVGDAVDVQVGPSADVDLGIAGSHQILVDGEVADMGDDPLATATHPRTAVGISKDGTELFVLVLDGRSAQSRGMSLFELAELLRDMGAHNAVNLDGGGSSAMAARVAGDDGPKIWNSPSDGTVREVPNALVFYSDAPADTVSDVQIREALTGQTRVLSGMHRTVTATGLGGNLSPIPVDGEFAADGAAQLADANAERALVQGSDAGSAQIRYRHGAWEDSLALSVLGAPVALTPSERAISLPDGESTATVTLTGVDSDGRRARVETADVKVTASDGFTVTDDGLGTWTVQGTGAADAGTLTFRHGDLSTSVALTFGTSTVPVFDFSDPSAFSDESARATGSFRAAEGPVGPDGTPTPAIGMEYDFTTSTATRGYYLVANDPVTVEGTTRALTLDVRGDSTGAWPRLQIKDAAGTVTNLDGPHIDTDGWHPLTFTVPDGLPQPITVERIRIMETRPDASYTGSIAVANLQAITTPTAAVDPEQHIHDPALLSQGSVEERPQRIAVMSDAQFVATDPDSASVEGARRTLREIREAAPDLLVINGDFVDEASPEDFALARKILDEEWDSSIPFVYVPGNHEIMGGDIASFEAAFGEVTTSQDLDGTRVITLNSAYGSLNGGGIDQIAELERQLEEARESESVTGVVVMFHHPPSDPLPSKLSQLSDQREARAIERELGIFRAESGKSAAVINGHVGVFHGSAVDGVTYLINGNSGKQPAGTPQTGGFTGWTMVGIDPSAGVVGSNPGTQDRVDWLAAETRPWVDTLNLVAPAELDARAEDPSQVSATLVQDGREVPVAWPVTAQWGGQGVLIEDGRGDEQVQSADAVVRLNPRTGMLTALRNGTATLTVTVNGRTAEQQITVTGADAADPGAPGDPGDGGDGDDGGDSGTGDGDTGSDDGNDSGDGGDSGSGDDQGSDPADPAPGDTADGDDSGSEGDDAGSGNGSDQGAGDGSGSGTDHPGSDGDTGTAGGAGPADGTRGADGAGADSSGRRSPSGRDDLARTGTDAGWMLGLGGAVITVGVGALAARRRMG